MGSIGEFNLAAKQLVRPRNQGGVHSFKTLSLEDAFKAPFLSIPWLVLPPRIIKEPQEL